MTSVCLQGTISALRSHLSSSQRKNEASACGLRAECEELTQKVQQLRAKLRSAQAAERTRLANHTIYSNNTVKKLQDIIGEVNTFITHSHTDGQLHVVKQSHKNVILKTIQAEYLADFLHVQPHCFSSSGRDVVTYGWYVSQAWNRAGEGASLLHVIFKCWGTESGKSTCYGGNVWRASTGRVHIFTNHLSYYSVITHTSYSIASSHNNWCPKQIKPNNLNSGTFGTFKIDSGLFFFYIVLSPFFCC